MAWLSCDKYGIEVLFTKKPERCPNGRWEAVMIAKYVILPKGSIKKLIGRELSWSDNPVELE